MPAQTIAQSLLSRIELWFNSLSAWLDKPLFGHGFGSFEWAYMNHRADHPWPSTILMNPTVSPGAAHNEFIQGLVELGFVGTALVCWLLWLLLRRKHPARWALLIATSIALIEFPLQNPATIGLIVVAAGLLARREGVQSAVSPSARLVLSAAAVSAVCVMTWTGYASYVAARYMGGVKYLIESGGDPLRALMLNSSAYDVFPLGADARRQLSGSLIQTMSVYGRRIAVNPDVADYIYEAGRTVSPWDTLTLVSRAQYLLKRGRIADLAPIVVTLQRTAPRVPHTWLMAGWFFRMNGQPREARQAARIGLPLTHDPVLRAHFERLL